MAQRMLKNIDRLDVYHAIKCSVAVNAESLNKLREHGRLVEEDREIDENYKKILLNILKGCILHHKGKDGDNNGERNALKETRPPILESCDKQRNGVCGNRECHAFVDTRLQRLLSRKRYRGRGNNNGECNVLEETDMRRLETRSKRRGRDNDNGDCCVLEGNVSQRVESRHQKKDIGKMVKYNAEEENGPQYEFPSHNLFACGKSYVPDENDAWSAVCKFKPGGGSDDGGNEGESSNDAAPQFEHHLLGGAAKLQYCICGQKDKAAANEYGVNRNNEKKGKELSRSVRLQVELSSHLLGVQNIHKKSNGMNPSIQRIEAQAVKNVNNSPNRVAPVPEYHLLQSVQHEDNPVACKHNGCIVPNKKILGVNHKIEKNRRVTRAMSQRSGVSGRMLDVENLHKYDKTSAPVYKISGFSAQKKHDQVRLSTDTRQKVGLLIEISAAGNWHMHDIENSNSLTRRKSLNEAGKEDIAECSRAAQYRISKNRKSDIVKCSSATQYRNVKAAGRAMKNKEIGKTIADEDNKDKTTSSVEILDSSAFGIEWTKSPFVPTKKIHYNEKLGASHARKNSKFRRHLLEFLRRAYDKEEYARLRREAEAAQYFLYYPDLKRKLIKWRYKPGKRLNILRGFFFWIQNVAQEGSFKPWKDGECLAVEPPHP